MWIAILVLALSVCIGIFWMVCIRMPQPEYNPPSSPSWDGESSVWPKHKDYNIEQQLRALVTKLADEIGERNLHRLQALNESADFLETFLIRDGYQVERQTFQVNGIDCHNLIAEITGRTYPDKILIVGAHYDTASGTPGANDNGSGVAALLVIAQVLHRFEPESTIRFVAFTNEEPPYFQTENQMGSWVYARRCRQRGEDLIGILSLETMGYFSDEENSQKYPPLVAEFYPHRGNFIGFVGNLQSRAFLNRTIKSFRTHSQFPSEGASLPGSIPGVGWSDHWSFWQEGYPGVMITDTAPFRYPHYHQPSDTPDKLDYHRFSQIVEGLIEVIKDLAT